MFNKQQTEYHVAGLYNGYECSIDWWYPNCTYEKAFEELERIMFSGESKLAHRGESISKNRFRVSYWESHDDPWWNKKVQLKIPGHSR